MKKNILFLSLLLLQTTSFFTVKSEQSGQSTAVDNDTFYHDSEENGLADFAAAVKDIEPTEKQDVTVIDTVKLGAQLVFNTLVVRPYTYCKDLFTQWYYSNNSDNEQETEEQA